MDKLTNTSLWDQTNQTPVETNVLSRKWQWVEHTLRKPAASITRQALRWNHQGQRRRGRPKKLESYMHYTHRLYDQKLSVDIMIRRNKEWIL